MAIPSSKAMSSSPLSRAGAPTHVWTHKPKKIVLAWLLISVPLVIWDTGYVLLRPLSMTGGSLHWMWIPYEIYMRTDYVYGWKAIEDGNGFTAAQGSMNIPETLLYIIYLWIVYTNGIESKASNSRSSSRMFVPRYLGGRPAALAVLIVFAGALMTFSKTLLYGLNEIFSGFSNVGHNEWGNLIAFYIIPSGLWLVASGLMTVGFGKEIYQGLSIAGTPLREAE